MIRPVSLYIGLRYTRARKRSGFISFISLASMLGIALGVTVLITVLSVMNGFDQQIKQRFFAMAPQVTVTTAISQSHRWADLQKTVQSVPQVVASAPFVSGQAMLTNDGQVSAVNILGIDPAQEAEVSALSHYLVAGKLKSLQQGSYHIILGKKLAESLGVQVGGNVNVFTPQTSISPLGVYPRFRRFYVSGIFSTNSAFGFDSSMAYINLNDAAALFPPPHGVQGLHIKLHDLYQAGLVTQALQQKLAPYYSISNWIIQSGDFFRALAMEKIILFVILFLIIAVAVFNLVSSLVMIVNDKRADIAILRTIGASPGMIMSTFVIQGAVVGLIGTFLGLIGGVLLSLNITRLVNAIQSYFHVQLLSAQVNFINFVPSQLQFSDVWHVCVLAFGLSLLATIYPAFSACRTQPAEALRYE